MRLLTKMTSLMVLTVSTLSLSEANAFCAKCAKIEQERAEEQAKRGPQPLHYYDEEFKNQISNVDNPTAPTNTTNLRSKTSTDEVNSPISSKTVNLPAEQTYSSIYAILQSKGLLKVLSGPFTIFVPSNDALRSLPPGTLHNLLRPENRERLATLVGNHVVDSKITDLKNNMNIKTINGKNLTISSQNGVTTVNGAKVLKTENFGNGVVYVVDQVFQS